MHRFYLAQKVSGNQVSISDAGQLHHLRNVLRLKAGDTVVLFDSEGNEYTCLITEMPKDKAMLTVQTRKPAGSKRYKLTIACAIPKKGGMDDIIDNLTQLGVDTIIPMETERVITKLDDSKRDTRLERWKKIARQAAQQSQRNSIPVIESITDVENVVSRSRGFVLKLIPTLSEGTKPIKEVLAESKPASIVVLIGPEGDFTPEEIKMAESAGFIPVSLGDTVLRVGTAAVAVASFIKFSLSG